MFRLYEAANRVEAQMLTDFLLNHRVSAVILGDYLAGAAGEIPANIFPAVWLVDDRDLVRAKQLLTRFQKMTDTEIAADSWICPKCGEDNGANFDLCWHCGHAH